MVLVLAKENPKGSAEFDDISRNVDANQGRRCPEVPERDANPLNGRFQPRSQASNRQQSDVLAESTKAMASYPAQTLPNGSQTPRVSSSPERVFDDYASSKVTTPTSRPPTRNSSVRFEDDNERGGPSMPRIRSQSAEADEIVPIRTADGHASRTYNTTEADPHKPSQSSEESVLNPNADEDAPASEKPSWVKRLAEKYGPVTLDNKGSVARDHLALERTFLAWLRTSLAFASIGIAVTQLFRLNTSIQNRPQTQGLPGYPTSTLPLSPLLGYGLPIEIVPLLQQLATASAHALPDALPTNTLLDQYLALQQRISLQSQSFQSQQLDEHVAAKLRQVGKPLGATFIGISIIVLLVGFHRYFEAQYWVIRGKFPASRGSVALIGLIAGALIIASFVVVLVISPVSYERR